MQSTNKQNRWQTGNIPHKHKGLNQMTSTDNRKQEYG